MRSRYLTDRVSRLEGRAPARDLPIMVIISDSLPAVTRSERTALVEEAAEQRRFLIHCGPLIEGEAGSEENSRGTDEMPVLVISDADSKTGNSSA